MKFIVRSIDQEIATLHSIKNVTKETGIDFFLMAGGDVERACLLVRNFRSFCAKNHLFHLARFPDYYNITWFACQLISTILIWPVANWLHRIFGCSEWVFIFIFLAGGYIYAGKKGWVWSEGRVIRKFEKYVEELDRRKHCEN
jgi:hypothetical protein